MANTIKRLDANDCFDYFVNNFDSIYKNESTYRHNPTLDPEITNEVLYTNLKDHYTISIFEQPSNNNFDVRFTREQENSADFIIAIFTNTISETQIFVEINRDDSDEMINELFQKGLRTLRSTFASEVYEMKSKNHLTD